MKYYLLLIFTTIHCLTFAQDISIEFENSSIKDVLINIESQTNYQFFFVEEWIDGVQVSGKYVAIPIVVILDDLLNTTELNYYISNDNKIIFTKNNIIYDRLPDGFFGDLDKEDTQKEIIEEERIAEDELGNFNPVFFDESTNSANKKIETIRIGKENKSGTNNVFVLSGFISHTLTEKPIANATLKIVGENIGVVSNDEGFFEIELPIGLNKIEIKSLGFEDVQKNIIIYNNGRVDIGLSQQIESLGEVIIKSNVEKNIADVNTGATTIDVKKVKNIPLVLGERDIFKVAAALPGITSAGEGASGYNVRGGKTDQNLYLLDDGVIYNPTHFFGLFSAINPFTTGSVNIYKGNIPAEYGGRLSSVFDMKTKDSNTEKFSGEASIGPVTSNIALEIPIVKEKSSVLIGGRSTYSDWILNTLDDERLKNSNAFFYDAIIKYNTKVNENNSLKVTGYYSKDKFSITSDSTYNYSNRLVSARWNHDFNDKHRGSMIFTNSEYRFDIGFDGNSNTDFDFGYKNNETEFKFQLNYFINPSHTLSYGISSKYYKINPGELEASGSESIVVPKIIPQEQGLESAVYISDEFKVSDKFMLHAGFRYSYYIALGEADQRIYEDGLPKNEATLIDTVHFDKNETIETYGGPEVRLSARYFLGNDYSVKASFNNTNQYIHTISNNTTVSPTDTWKLSDINIKPQEALQYSLGFFKNFEDNLYELSIEGYYKKSDNVLDYKVGAQFLLNETLETEVLQGEGKAYGIELLFRKTKGRLNGWVGYTYSRSFFKLDGDFAEETVNKGEYFPSNYDKPHDLSIVSNYKITQRFSVSANFVYQTGRPVTVPVGNFILNDSEFVLYSDRNEYRIPDYYRLDLSFNVEGNHKLKKLAHSFWNFSIYNVLGRNNPYSVFFVTENGEVKAYQSSIFSVPIPTITYNLKF